MIFDFLKKKDDDVPDVGREDEFDQKNEKPEEISGPEPDSEEEDDEEEEEEKPGKKGKKGKRLNKKYGKEESYSEENIEVEKLQAKLEALDSIIKGYGERFSTLSGQLGELRAMSLENEKKISTASAEGARAADIVREVKPEKLRIDYQKADMKVQELEGRIENVKQFSETIMNEIKDLRRKAGVFVGTDALLRLNEEVKKDLIEIQKVESKVRVNADKSEGLFIEIRRAASENEKIAEQTKNMNGTVAELQKEMEKVKLDFSSIVSDSDFSDFKKNISSRMLNFDNAIEKTEKMKEDIYKMERLIETVLGLEKKNREDIDDVSVSVGDENIKKVEEYEARFNSLLSIIDTLAGDIIKLKKKSGMPSKISVNKSGKLKHIKNHPAVRMIQKIKRKRNKSKKKRV